MALGLLLRQVVFMLVSWICFLLFDGSASLPAIKGYGYPHTSDSRNIGDDADDEVFSSAFDQSDWQASNDQPTGPGHTSYSKPSVAHQPAWAPSRHNLPSTPSGPEVEKLINGAPRDWGLENFDKPIQFPLPSGPAKPQPGTVQTQSSPSIASPSAGGGSTHYASPAAYDASTATSQAAEPPRVASWQPEPDGSGYGVVDVKTGSSAAGSNFPHLVFENVFRYPSENTELSQSYGTVSNTAGGTGHANYAATHEKPSFPHYPTNAEAQPVYPSGMGSYPGRENLNFGQTTYQPSDELSWSPQKQAVVPQRVSEPILPSYIVQSRNGYQRAKYHRSTSKYSPQFPSPMSVSSKGVKGPAPSQPAAPKGVKNPQRAKW